MTDAPRRIQRSRAKGWRMPDNTVYVGRPSVWQNPFGPVGSAASIPCDDPLQAVHLHYEMVAKECAARRRVPNYIMALRGKNLACWCRLDQPCHADILLYLANGAPMALPEKPDDPRILDPRQLPLRCERVERAARDGEGDA
jgi:hypothetical protein